MAEPVTSNLLTPKHLDATKKIDKPQHWTALDNGRIFPQDNASATAENLSASTLPALPALPRNAPNQLPNELPFWAARRY